MQKRKKVKFKVGSKLIEGGRVYNVYKIKKEKVLEKTQRIIHYRPFYMNCRNDDIDCSIPESNLDQTDMREPVTKKEIRKILRSLSVKSGERKRINPPEAKTSLYLNDIHKTFDVIKSYWGEKKQNGSEFTKVKKDILGSGTDRAVEEVAYIIGISLDNAKQKIIKALESKA